MVTVCNPFGGITIHVKEFERVFREAANRSCTQFKCACPFAITATATGMALPIFPDSALTVQYAVQRSSVQYTVQYVLLLFE